MKKNAWWRSTTFLYTLIGVLLGLGPPLVGSILEVLLEGRTFSASSLLAVQQSQPLLWLLDAAPFVTGAFSYYIGRQRERLLNFTSRLEEEISRRTAEFARANQQLKREMEAREKN